MLSVLGQRRRPSGMIRFERLNAVGSSPERRANPEVDNPFLRANSSMAAQIQAWVNVCDGVSISNGHLKPRVPLWHWGRLSDLRTSSLQVKGHSFMRGNCPQRASDSATRLEMTHFVYKVCSSLDWDEAVRAGSFLGSADDLRDGYIHLSTAEQLAGTLAKFFRGRADHVLVAFEAGALGPKLKWEAARNGELFPHLYAALPASLALAVTPLTLDADGVHQLPKDLA